MSTTDRCPCIKCEDRHFKCHASCERYKTFKAENEEIRKKRAIFYRNRYGTVSEAEYKEGAMELYARRISRKD